MSLFAVVLFYLSAIGWGLVLAETCRVRGRFDFGLLGGLGFAFFTIVGGVLNLAGWISPTLLLIGISVGPLFLAVAIGFRHLDILNGSTIAGFNRAAATALLIVALTGWVLWMTGDRPYNPGDDYHGYLVFPVRMIQAESRGMDPFNERMLLSYGGQDFLNAVMLSLVPLQNIRAMEMGVAWMVLLGLVAGHCRRRLIGAWTTGAILIVVSMLTPMVTNISSVVSGAVLFYTLTRLFPRVIAERDRVRVAVVACVLAGIFSLKNNMIPAGGLMLLALYATSGLKPKRKCVAEVLCVSAFASVLLAPWIAAMYRSSGTLLYPTLGLGLGAYAPADYIAPVCWEGARVTISRGVRVILHAPGWWMSVALALLAWRWQGWGILAAAWGGAFVLGMVSGNPGCERYIYSFVFAAFLWVLVQAVPINGVGRWWKYRYVAVLCLLVLLAWEGVKRSRPWARGHGAENLTAGRDELRDLQREVPAGWPILVRASRPFNLDFRRNPIYVVDWPGGSSPAPGMPVDGNVNDIVTYLRGNGIAYVLYSYVDKAGFSRAAYGDRMKLVRRKGHAGRIGVLAKYCFAFQDDLEILREHCRTVDNGRACVIDLTRPSKSQGERNDHVLSKLRE